MMLGISVLLHNVIFSALLFWLGVRLLDLRVLLILEHVVHHLFVFACEVPQLYTLFNGVLFGLFGINYYVQQRLTKPPVACLNCFLDVSVSHVDVSCA